MEALSYVFVGSALILLLVYLKARYLDFAGQMPSDYSGAPGEAFDLRTHLNGPIECEGVIYGPTGRVTSRFTGEFEARWDGNKGVMKEHFKYDSGSEQRREWHLTIGNDGRIKAEAPDVVGTGVGTQSGPTVQFALSDPAGRRGRWPCAGYHRLDVSRAEWHHR
jgi:hypothetical protein